MNLFPLIVAALLGSASAAQLTVLASADPAQIHVRVSQDDWFAQRPDAPGDSAALNLLRNVARLLPDPRSGAEVVCLPPQGQAVVVFTDAFGYAICQFPAVPVGEVRVAVQGASPVQVTPPDFSRATRITVTDLDDTLIRTGVAQGRALQNVLTANGTTRPIFAEMPAFLQHQATLGPVVYLSNSPDGLLVSLEALLRIHHFPAGPLFLRDLLRESAAEHKAAVLDALARTTTARLILVGDSGERDPEVYRRFVQDHPGRVERVLIRDVSTPARLEEVQRLFSPLEVPLTLLPAAP
ncbi:phosphatase domain-containing protein [Deinococcus oregonensis]|uniref:Phosphatase domain-containing protein n=1 Tax=Deinococcus oregonensis TaxID=1805970 RepID=A0ABV6AV21_9DEIO